MSAGKGVSFLKTTLMVSSTSASKRPSFLRSPTRVYHVDQAVLLLHRPSLAQPREGPADGHPPRPLSRASRGCSAWVSCSALASLYVLDEVEDQAGNTGRHPLARKVCQPVVGQPEPLVPLPRAVGELSRSEARVRLRKESSWPTPSRRAPSVPGPARGGPPSVRPAAGNDLDLFSEEYGTGLVKLFGIFPQGLSHLSHITATAALADGPKGGPHVAT
jgi:hypothetical protein